MRSFMSLFVLVGLLLLTVGCGTMFQGSTQIVEIESSPSGAQIEASPGIGEYTTPASIQVSRKYSYDLTFSKEGYKTCNKHLQASAKFGYVFLDVFFTGLVGVVVDAVTGGWNGIKPETLPVILEKEDMGAAGPDKIEVKIATTDGKIRLESDGEPINVHVDVSD